MAIGWLVVSTSRITCVCTYRTTNTGCSVSPLPRLHHHDIMAIVELFFIYVPFVTIRRVMLVR